jgi:DNA polymerase-3 subunit delta
VVVNATDDNVGSEINQACAPTLFGEDVFVVIEGIDNLNDDAVDQLKALIAELPENVWLLLTHPGGMKRKPLIDAVVAAGGEKVECKELRRGRDTTDFLVKEVTARKRTMTPAALNVLMESLGQDLPALVNAIDQLCSDVEKDPIDEPDIRSQIEGTAPISGFAISDSVWERKAREAITLLRQSSLETDPGRLGVTTVTALTSGLRSLIAVGGSAPGASDNDIAREAGVPPWKVKALRHQWSRWSGDQRKLAGMIVALADADPAMKGGVTVGSSLDPEQKLFELEKLITRASS